MLPWRSTAKSDARAAGFVDERYAPLASEKWSRSRMSACRIRKPVGQNDFGFGSCEHRVSVGVGTSMVNVLGKRDDHASGMIKTRA
jgi:hypothetical protein